MRNFDIQPMSQYRRGTNGHEHKFKGVLHMKPKTWQSVFAIVLVTAMLVTICAVINQYNKKLEQLGSLPQVKFTYHIPQPTPIPTKKDIVFSQKHGDILWRIYGLESSYGKLPFPYCTKRGLVSDMGYNVLNHQCFQSFSEEVATVESWVEKHEDLPLGQILCIYNKGEANRSCDYSMNFMSL